MVKVTKEAALAYHAQGKPGKIEVVPTKPYSTQTDLSLAYSPGVAEPCLEIQKNPDDAYRYTNKGNLVAVISNGTAVLGLGDIGAVSGKPVMEGKSLLFKIYAGVDAFDIEVDEKDPERFIQAVKAIAPTFGGINLEDIKAPECFEIERRLKEELDIPVMHDDQHGTAIISCAGLINALDVAGKDISRVRIVINGAGAAAISCTRLYCAFGAKKENIVMLDSKGVIRADRTDLNAQKPSTELMSSSAFPKAMSSRRTWCAPWPTSPSSLPWPIPCPKSPTRPPKKRAPMCSCPPAAPTIPTKSTTSSASPTSSAERSTPPPAPSTRR